MSARRTLAAVVAAMVTVLPAGCAPADDTEELEAHLTIGVIKDRDAERETKVLICPGRTSKERDICAALDVVAPKVFRPVSPERVCTAIYGGPATATVRGTFEDDLVDASFSQQNGCELGRWKQMVPVLKALKLL
ncbi:MAG TPA: hypothetical protein VK948_01515 [Aeromicrobium sp.]|nr:hypothetical protein [Aeromicrobium sp.]